MAEGVSSGASITLPSSKNCTTSSTDYRVGTQDEKKEGDMVGCRRREEEDTWIGQVEQHTEGAMHPTATSLHNFQ